MTWQDAVRAQIDRMRVAFDVPPSKPHGLQLAERNHNKAKEDFAADPAGAELQLAQQKAREQNKMPDARMRELQEVVAAHDKKMREAFAKVIAERENYGPEFLKEMAPLKEEGEQLILHLIDLLEEAAKVQARVHSYAMSNGLPSFRLWDRAGRLAQMARECRWLVKD